MASDDVPDVTLAALADALRVYAAGCTPSELVHLVETLDDHGVEVAGVNVPDKPPAGGAA